MQNQHQQQQQMQQLQAQQQQMQQQMQQSLPMGAGNAQLFQQGGVPRGVGQGGGPGPGFPPGAGPNLQGPLAYLEKTASNIGEPTVRIGPWVTIHCKATSGSSLTGISVPSLYRSSGHGRWSKVTRAGQGSR